MLRILFEAHISAEIFAKGFINTTSFNYPCK